jgi:hypothetical protein
MTLKEPCPTNCAIKGVCDDGVDRAAQLGYVNTFYTIKAGTLQLAPHLALPSTLALPAC